VFGMFINGQEDVCAANADGSRAAQVTNTPDSDNTPGWGRVHSRAAPAVQP
jgi:hypothetical protein